MNPQEVFIKNVEASLNKHIGSIIAGSVLKNNLAKLNKPVAYLAKEDGRVLIEHIVKAVSLFAAKDESKHLKAELETFLDVLV